MNHYAIIELYFVALKGSGQLIIISGPFADKKEAKARMAFLKSTSPEADRILCKMTHKIRLPIVEVIDETA